MKKAAVLGIAAMFLAGCSTGIISSKIENGIRDSLPDYIGPAKEYKVQAKGSETGMISGSIDRLLIDGTDVQLKENLVIDRMSIDMSKVRFNPRTRKVKKVESTTFEAEISPKSMNAYISKSDDDKNKIKIRLEDSKVIVDASPGFMGISIPVSIKGSPSIIGNSKIDFVADEASISIIPLPAFIINKLLRNINPVLDMSQMKFPVSIQDITIKKDKVIIKGSAEFQTSED